jgi:riboflavin kinase
LIVGVYLVTKGWVEALVVLAREATKKGEVRVSSSWLAGRLGGSKQTAIRRLEELESQGMISRRIEPQGQVIRISPVGMSSLRALHRELETILKPSTASFTLSGRVVTGMGEGSYYMGQPRYAEQFKRELGFSPYPGTLDIKLDRASLELKEVLLRTPSNQVEGFKTSERTFGPVRFFRARLKGTNGAIVLPNRTHHSDILEVISPRCLRRTAGLRDGNIVNVEVSL